MAAPDGACWAVSQREPSHIQKVRVSRSKRTSPLVMSGPCRSNVTSLCFQFIARRKPMGPGSQVVACLTFSSGRKEEGRADRMKRRRPAAIGQEAEVRAINAQPHGHTVLLRAPDHQGGVRAKKRSSKRSLTASSEPQKRAEEQQS